MTWPEAVGRPLQIVYVPAEVIPGLVEKEEQAGRTRLELQYFKDAESDTWQYDVAPPSAPAGGRASAVPRGLASALPAQVRPVNNNLFPLGMPAQAPSGPILQQDRLATGPSRGRLFDQTQARSAGPVASGSNAIRANPAQVPVAPLRPVSQREPLVERTQGRDGDRENGQVWRPASKAAEDLYKRTKASPELYYRPVDVVAAGRRIRDLERESRKYTQPPRRLPHGVRDSYRP